MWPNVGVDAAELLKKLWYLLKKTWFETRWVCPCRINPSCEMATASPYTGEPGEFQISSNTWDLPNWQDSHKFFAALDSQGFVMSFTKKSVGNLSNNFKQGICCPESN